MDFDLTEANAAVSHAQSTRRLHARRTKKGTQQRETDLKIAVERVREAMKPLRRAIARLPYDDTPAEHAARMRSASARLQRERRKLWKLAQPPKERRR